MNLVTFLFLFLMTEVVSDRDTDSSGHASDEYRITEYQFPFTLLAHSLPNEDFVDTIGGSASIISTAYTRSPLSSTRESNEVGSEAWVWTFPWETWDWISTLKTLASFVGICGNSLVIAVVYKRRSSCRPPDSLIASLAFADLLGSLALLSSPMAIRVPNTWLAHLYCKFVFFDIPIWMSVTVSSYTLMGMSVERYLAVAYPLYYKVRLDYRMVRAYIAVVWVGSFLLNIDFLVLTDIDIGCVVNNVRIISIYNLVIRLLIPIIVMVVFQLCMARSLHKSGKNFGGAGSRGRTTPSFHVVARNRVMITVSVVIVIYIALWTPAQVVRAKIVLGILPEEDFYDTDTRQSVSYSFLNACVNPVIYIFAHAEFRKAVWGVIFRRRQEAKSIFGEVCNSASTRWQKVAV